MSWGSTRVRHSSISSEWCCSTIEPWLHPSRLAVRGRTRRFSLEHDQSGRPTGCSAGRRELELVDAVIAGLRSAQGAVLVVSGVAGVGKTRLVEVALTPRGDARPDGPLVAWGRCVAGEAAPVAWPWLQIAGGLGPLGSALAEELRAPPAHAGPGEPRAMAYEAIVAAVLDVARVSPLVIVIDDLQWADATTHHIVRLLLSRLDEAPQVLVVTVRSEGRGTDLTETMAELARSRSLRRIELDGLDDRAIGECVQAVTGEPADAGLVEMLARRTGGNAFYLTELIRLGGSQAASIRSTLETVVPTSVRDVIRARVSLLPATGEQLLTCAAVVGRSFDWRVVAAMSGVADDLALDGFDAALVSGLIHDGETQTRFRFSHDLVGEALYADLSEPRRARLHARAVAALVALHAADAGHANEIAAHAWAGRSALEPQQVAGHLLAAARAAGPLAPEQAESQLRKALEVIEALAPGAEPRRAGERRRSTASAAGQPVPGECQPGFAGAAGSRSRSARALRRQRARRRADADLLGPARPAALRLGGGRGDRR